MPRLTEQTRQIRRERIAEAAMRCFARQGISGTSMADIIAESGMSSGSIYSNFENRADLVRFVTGALIGSKVDAIGEHAAEDAEPLTPGGVFTQIASNGMDRDLARTVVQAWVEVPRDPELAGIAQRNITTIRVAVHSALQRWATDRDLDDQSLADTVETVVAASQGYIARLALDTKVDPDRVREQIARGLDRAD